MDMSLIALSVALVALLFSLWRAFVPHETEAERQQRLGRKLLGLDR